MERTPPKDRVLPPFSPDRLIATTRKTFVERKIALRKLLKHEPNGIQYVEHIESDGDGRGEIGG